MALPGRVGAAHKDRLRPGAGDAHEVAVEQQGVVVVTRRMVLESSSSLSLSSSLLSQVSSKEHAESSRGGAPPPTAVRCNSAAKAVGNAAVVAVMRSAAEPAGQSTGIQCRRDAAAGVGTRDRPRMMVVVGWMIILRVQRRRDGASGCRAKWRDTEWRLPAVSAGQPSDPPLLLLLFRPVLAAGAFVVVGDGDAGTGRPPRPDLRGVARGAAAACLLLLVMRFCCCITLIVLRTAVNSILAGIVVVLCRSTNSIAKY